jgi:hypothetical protein
MRLCPSPRDSAFRGHRCIAATDIRPPRASPVTFTLRQTLWQRRLSLSRRVLELLADTRGGNVYTNKEHAGCDEC